MITRRLSRYAPKVSQVFFDGPAVVPTLAVQSISRSTTPIDAREKPCTLYTLTLH
jgi:hypothetical protein